MELTKEYFDEKFGGIKEDLGKVQEDITFLKVKVVNIEAKVERIDKRDKEDSNVFAKDILKPQKDVKQLQLKHAA
ncbi:MAG TPA: hypothetical protein VE973_02510 [Candidatus Limnocylindria bacterium]|nr:hypothetical protein [Candidatus Limnocylindria bacterium]